MINVPPELGPILKDDKVRFYAGTVKGENCDVVCSKLGGNLQSYWTKHIVRKLRVVLHYT